MKIAMVTAVYVLTFFTGILMGESFGMHWYTLTATILVGAIGGTLINRINSFS